jgi:hypothetical protein
MVLPGYLHYAKSNAPISTSPSDGRGILSIVARTRKARATRMDYSQNDARVQKAKGRDMAVGVM